MLPIVISCYAMLRCLSRFWEGSYAAQLDAVARRCGEGARGRQLCCLAGTVEREPQEGSYTTPLSEEEALGR